MTQSITNKISTATKNGQKHTDPPGLWVVLFFGSVALHLLAFWLLYQYKSNSYSKQKFSSAVPIELINISPEKQSPTKPKSEAKPQVKAKPVPPKVSRSQKLNSAPPPQSGETNLENQNSDGVDVLREQQIAAEQQRQQQLAAEQQRQEQIAAQQQRQQQLAADQKLQQELADQKRQQELADQKLQQELADQKRQQELADQKRQQELADQKRQQELADQKRQQESQSTQQGESSDAQANTVDKNTNDNATAANNPQELEDLPDVPTPGNNSSRNDLNDDLRGSIGQREDLAKNPIPKPNQSDITTDGGKPLPEANIGGFIATWEIDRTALKKDIQDKAADITTNRKEFDLKDINSPSLSAENLLEPVEFQALILINRDGSFNSLIAKPPQYQEYAEKIFQDQKYIPAESGGRSPDLSRILVKVKIKLSQP